MSSVYEALQRARQGGYRPIPLRPQAVRNTDRSPTLLAPGPDLVAAALTPLLAAVRPLLDGDKGAVLQVVAATAGEGCSVIARGFAMLAATTGHRRILLVDGDRDNPHTARSFGHTSEHGLVDGLAAGFNDVLHPVPGAYLSVARLIGEREPGSASADGLRDLYAALRERFPLTIIDCPPVGGGTYLDLLPEAADGVILVVEAEKTRPAVVVHAKGMIQQAGGNLLGAVFNKRRNYIPEILYRLL